MNHITMLPWPVIPVHIRLPWHQSPECSCPDELSMRCQSVWEWGTFLHHHPPATHTCSASYQCCRMSSLSSLTYPSFLVLLPSVLLKNQAKFRPTEVVSQCWSLACLYWNIIVGCLVTDRRFCRNAVFLFIDNDMREENFIENFTGKTHRTGILKDWQHTEHTWEYS